MCEIGFQTVLNSNERIKIVDFSASCPKPNVVFKRYSQNQQFLLHKNINDFIGSGHIARLISEIIEGKDVFIDHTKIEANANKHKIVWRKQVERQSTRIDAELDELFTYIDKLNEDEEKIFGNKDLPEQERNKFNDEKVKEIIEKINDNVKKEKMTKEDGREQRKNVRRTKELLERKESYKLKKKN